MYTRARTQTPEFLFCSVRTGQWHTRTKGAGEEGEERKREGFLNSGEPTRRSLEPAEKKKQEVVSRLIQRDSY